MSFDPRVEVIQEGVVYHTQHRTFLVYQPERDGDEGEPVNKVRRSYLHVRKAVAECTIPRITVDGVNTESRVVC